MKKIFTMLLVVVVGLMIAGQLMVWNKARKDSQELKKLKENVELVINYDSTLSARESMMLDSIREIREELERIKQLQHNENKKLRKQNEALEKRFRDLDVGDRPDF